MAGRGCFERLVRDACGLLNADCAVLYPYDAQERKFFAGAVAWGLNQSKDLNVSKPRTKGLAAIVRYASPLIVHDVDARDPWTYVLVAAVLIGTNLAAAWLPAHRASRISPAEALRAKQMQQLRRNDEHDHERQGPARESPERASGKSGLSGHCAFVQRADRMRLNSAVVDRSCSNGMARHCPPQVRTSALSGIADMS